MGIRAWLRARQVSAVPLGLFRIAFALVAMMEILQIYIFRDLIFSAPLHPRLASLPIVGYLLSLPNAPIVALWGLAVASLLVGFHTRIAALVSYVLAVSILGLRIGPSGFGYEADSLLLSGFLVLTICPSGQALSVDSLRHKGRLAARREPFTPPTISSFSLILISVVLGLMYLDAGLCKLASPMYRQGLGAWLPASLPFTNFYDTSWLFPNELISRSLGYFVVATELLFLVLIWFERTAVLAIFCGFMLQAGITLVFPIPLLGLVAGAFYMALVPSAGYARVAQTWQVSAPRIVVYYDWDCPLCRRTAAIITALDVRRAVKWAPVQMGGETGYSLPAGISTVQLLANIYSVDRRGRAASGIGTYSRVFRALGWTWPIGAALRVPWVLSLAERVYESVAGMRRRDPCSDDLCPAPPSKKEANDLSWQLAPYAVLLWCVGFVLLLPSNPIVGHSQVRDYLPLRRISYAARQVLFPLTGITTHAVFMDSHFDRYDRQIRLTYLNGSQSIGLPYIRSNGMVDLRNTGRVWTTWTFRAASPTRSNDEVIRRVGAFASFWAKRRGIDLSSGEILMEERPVTVSLLTWRAGALKSNVASPWHAIGSFVRASSNLWFRTAPGSAGRSPTQVCVNASDNPKCPHVTHRAIVTGQWTGR